MATKKVVKKTVKKVAKKKPVMSAEFQESLKQVLKNDKSIVKGETAGYVVYRMVRKGDTATESGKILRSGVMVHEMSTRDMFQVIQHLADVVSEKTRVPRAGVIMKLLTLS